MWRRNFWTSLLERLIGLIVITIEWCQVTPARPVSARAAFDAKWSRPMPVIQCATSEAKWRRRYAVMPMMPCDASDARRYQLMPSNASEMPTRPVVLRDTNDAKWCEVMQSNASNAHWRQWCQVIPLSTTMLSGRKQLASLRTRCGTCEHMWPGFRRRSVPPNRSWTGSTQFV